MGRKLAIGLLMPCHPQCRHNPSFHRQTELKLVRTVERHDGPGMWLIEEFDGGFLQEFELMPL